MPVIEVATWDLERLVGKRFTREELEDLLPRVKCEVEGFEGDVVYFEATHDRPDLFSAEGLARALKGLTGIEEGLPTFRVGEGRIKVINEGPDYRPYIFCAAVYGVKLDDEAIKQIMQLQEKLHVTYGRNRKKVSIGVYDLSAIKLPVKYTTVDPDKFSFVPLDFAEALTPREILRRHPKGTEYGHLIAEHDKYPLLVDSQGTVLSMPPIINSEDTRVTEDSRDLFIDVTTTDPRVALKVLTIVTTSIAEREGEIRLAEVEGKGRKWLTPPLDPEEMKLEVSLVERLAGLKLSPSEVASLLRKMRMGAEPQNDTVLATIPAYRADVLHPVDLVEDVVMAYGYDNLVSLKTPPPHPGREDPLEVFSRAVREAVVGLGFQEVNNYMLTNKEVLYAKMGVPEQPTVEVENPKQETYSCLRTWITPQLMEVLSKSKHADYPQRIFEVGDVVLIDESRENKTREERRLAFAIAGRGVTLTDALGVLKALMESFGLNYTLTPASHPSLIEGRAAKVTVSGREAGFLGEIHPKVLEAFDIGVPVVVTELSLNALREALLEL